MSQNHQHGSPRTFSSRSAFASQFAIGCTVATLMGFLGLSILYRPSNNAPAGIAMMKQTMETFGSSPSFMVSNEPQTQGPNHHRQQQEQDWFVGNDTPNEYHKYSCHFIFEVTPTPGVDQCTFARTCNDGAGVWAPFVFCNHRLSVLTWAALVSPIALLWMIVLFRMLASTAEDYFSPALEMFSVKLGLPPRFAGVTLLALGNGAADVSSTVSAITSDPDQGYQLSLGALSGAAMFITCVVSAVVVLVADGVPCRGALVRDVTMLLLTCLVVGVHLSRTGTVTVETTTLFITLYFLFVILVFVADVYHRAVILPRLARWQEEQERLRQIQAGDEAARIMGITTVSYNNTINNSDGINPIVGPGGGLGEPTASMTNLSTPLTNPQEQEAGGTGGLDATTTVPRPGLLASAMTALSNYDRQEQVQPFHPPMPGGLPTQSLGPHPGSVPGTGWGVESDDLLAQDRPIILRGRDGILRDTNHQHQHHHLTHGDGTTTPLPTHDVSAGAYAMLESTMDHVCVQPGSLFGPSGSWEEAFDQARQEILEHAHMVWEDIMWNNDVNIISKLLLLCELPFTALRKITVPIPCEGYYVRALVSISLLLSPGWFAYYLWREHEYNIFRYHWLVYVVIWSIAVIAAVAVLRLAPGGDGTMSLTASTPIALWGFVVAATWIDAIANALVSLLNFIGIVLRIPGPIIGLTILAWGNSVGDLSANVTMARKGLGNMAMTACFAGPVFNMLIGLGLGFGRLLVQTRATSKEVELSPSIRTGFVFLALNAALILMVGLWWGRGRIRKSYGYVSLVLYVVYLITGITLQYL